MRSSCSPHASHRPQTDPNPPSAHDDNPRLGAVKKFINKFRFILKYLMFIGNTGGVAVAVAFFVLSINDSGETDTVLFLLITNVVTNIQSCGSGVFKLHFDLNANKEVHGLFYFLLAASAALAVAAPIVHIPASPGDKVAPSMLLCATLLLCIEGCVGAFHCDYSAEQEMASRKADMEKGIAAQKTEENLRQQDKELTKKALRLVRREASQTAQRRRAKRRHFGVKKKAKPCSDDMTQDEIRKLASAEDCNSTTPIYKILFPKK